MFVRYEGEVGMKLQRTKRLLSVASVVAAAGVLPLISATPASADQGACTKYLANKGYLVGPKVKSACANPALHTPLGVVPDFDCTHGLRVAGVKDQHAIDACKRA
ncbi:hypothetical protein CHR28_22385 [Streptomyces sp. XY006]|nr:hypothetical protein CHR28_22385 [Streptomyces sp. XY006]